jgi:2,5-diamino-6-(ribosylamino)-4(3H)-pyrimidinone 5'-phosphate reductase
MHTQISVDGCVRGFNDTGIYYNIANRFNADMTLVGSETLRTAAEQFPPETEKSFVKPADRPDDKRAICAVPDSRGRLRNLHVFRDSDYIKDLILLVSGSTPEAYLEYLRERNYDFIMAGEDHVNYAEALEVLYDRYGCRIIRTDSGGILTNALLMQELVDEICLIISPCLIGKSDLHVFRSLSIPANIELELMDCEVIDENYICVNYRVLR